jgi:polysaccharide pyruvyl transferase WcaK-like protein
MAVGPSQEIAELKRAPGELSFEARLGDRAERVWFRTATEVMPTADAALAACLMPAMRRGGTLRMRDPVSAKVLRNQREFQAIQRGWSLDWTFDQGPLEEVEVIAPSRRDAPAPGNGRIAAFFSGGVDSWSTVLANPDLTDLIFVRGFDLLPAAAHQLGVADEAERRLGEAAAELGLSLHVVETNLRNLSDPLLIWDTFYGCAASSVALFLAPLFERVLIAGDSDYEVQVKYGANWLVDQLWSTERLEIVEDGGRRSRMERLRAISNHPIVQRTLRVCWQNRDAEYNCGRCRKCLMTMSGLDAIGVLGQVTSFPSELDLDAVAASRPVHPVSLALWEDLLDAVRESGRAELERAVEKAVVESRRGVGLSRSFRRRHCPGPPSRLTAADRRVRGQDRRSAAPVFATPATAEALAGAPAAIVLVGGYDGSGNYGDIAQLDAALGLLRALQPDLLVLPLVERSYAALDRRLLVEMLHPPEHELFFDPAGDQADELVRVDPPGALEFGACYLYGGGYLNRSWGERKLSMLAAAEALLSGTRGRIHRVSSGLQADAEWLSGLAPEKLGALRSFDMLGVRDACSGIALETIAAGDVVETADDAVGVLRQFPARPPARLAEELRLNVHFGQHGWAMPDPKAPLEFCAEFIAELGRQTGARVVVQPLIAYLDQRVDERPAVERLTDACASHGVIVAEAKVLRPAYLPELVPELQRAHLTLSCSYHVALTTLMLSVPTVLISDNPYYEQKAAGLLAAFDLPPRFVTRSSEDPRQRAGEIGAMLTDEDASADLRDRLATGAASLRRRRRLAEVELLGMLGVAAEGIVAPDELEEPAGGLVDPPSAGAARRLVERRRRTAERRIEAAKARLRTAELREHWARAERSRVLSSTSWRLTGPIRALSEMLRR